jgi:hypothetical protein
MAERDVTEFDLRAEEFKRRDIKPEDYEFRSDGKIVRKDRWINAIHRIQGIVGPAGHEFEIDDVVGAVMRAEKARRTLEGLRQKLEAELATTAGLMAEEESLPSIYGEHSKGISAAIAMLTELAAEHGYRFASPPPGTTE